MHNLTPQQIAANVARLERDAEAESAQRFAAHVRSNPDAKQETVAALYARARALSCSISQLKTQYARNAAQLRAMQAKAESTGKKVGNYTAQQLADRAYRFEQLAK